MISPVTYLVASQQQDDQRRSAERQRLIDAAAEMAKSARQARAPRAWASPSLHKSRTLLRPRRRPNLA